MSWNKPLLMLDIWRIHNVRQEKYYRVLNGATHVADIKRVKDRQWRVDPKGPFLQLVAPTGSLEKCLAWVHQNLN